MAAADRWVRWREAQGLNQLDAAKKAGFPQGSLSLIERGRKTPTLEQAVRIHALTKWSDYEVTPEMWAKDAATKKAAEDKSRTKKRKAA